MGGAVGEATSSLAAGGITEEKGEAAAPEEEADRTAGEEKQEMGTAVECSEKLLEKKMVELKDDGIASLFNNSVINQTTQNITDCRMVDTSANPIFISIHSLVFLVGFLLNGFIIKSYFSQAQQQLSNSLMIYLKNLTVADFMLCLSLPFRILTYATSSVTIHLLFCSFGLSAAFVNMYASIMFMGYIAANRYFKIVHPSRTHILQKVQSSHIISVGTWVLLLVVSITHTIILLATHKNMPSVTESCDSFFSASVTVWYFTLHIISTIIFLLVLIALLFFYCSISRRIQLAGQKQVSSSSSKKLVKSRKSILLLVCVFCICFVPFHIITLPYGSLVRSCYMKQFLYYVTEGTVILSVLNVCLDPLIYYIFCKSFRSQQTQDEKLDID
ncbi:P2Y purinoceptor 14-like [Pholidichthys leucotaenia]